jgi:cell wall-associated NlpC family hydrolase
MGALVLLSTSTTGDAFAAPTPSSPVTNPPLSLAAELSSTQGSSLVGESSSPPPALVAESTLADSTTAEPTLVAQTASAVRTASATDFVAASSVVVAFARSHLRARYRHASTGPSSFDCSGLMWRVFKEAGLSGKVTSTSARGIYQSYRARRLASRSNPQVGDLVVWGHGSHVGVYIGHGYAISALVQGVRVHRIRAMFTPFTAYLHTHLSKVVKPAWELQLARHMRSLRHTTRTVTLRAGASAHEASAGRLRSGARFVVLSRHRTGGRLWLEILTFSGRIGWLPSRVSAR